MNPIEIREALANDIDDVYRLVCELEDSQFSKPQFSEIYNRNIGKSSIAYFIAEQDDNVVGFASVYINDLLHHCGKVAEIQEFVVSSEFQRRGIGNLLFVKMKQWSMEKNALQIEVACNVLRTEAHQFYKALGFTDSHKKFVHPM